MTFKLHPRLTRDCIVLGDLPLCTVLLAPDARFAGFILVPRRAGIREAYELSQMDQDVLTRESATFGRAIMQAFDGDKLNVGALGNMVAQLHIHHIVRHEGDAVWPHAVWGNGTPKAYTAADIEIMRASVLGLKLPDFIEKH